MLLLLLFAFLFSILHTPISFGLLALLLHWFRSICSSRYPIRSFLFLLLLLLLFLSFSIFLLFVEIDLCVLFVVSFVFLSVGLFFPVRERTTKKHIYFFTQSVLMQREEKNIPVVLYNFLFCIDRCRWCCCCCCCSITSSRILIYRMKCKNDENSFRGFVITFYYYFSFLCFKTHKRIPLNWSIHICTVHTMH